MREMLLSESTQMGGYYIPETVVDDLIHHYEINKHLAGRGKSFHLGKSGVYPEFKDSMDLSIAPWRLPDSKDPVISTYIIWLQKCLEQYMKKYPMVNSLDPFNIIEDFNIQKYSIDGGFKAWHCERSGKGTLARILTFMTYMNDVEDGGTEFYFQKTIPAQKGLTIIFPVEWTHYHRGIPSKTKEKMVVSGWWGFKI
jgi:prolyl 4-hydroxylase